MLVIACGTVSQERPAATTPVPAAPSASLTQPSPTPTATAGACSGQGMPPENVLSRFFSLQSTQVEAATLADCWTATARGQRNFWDAMETWSRSRGVEKLETIAVSRRDTEVTFEVRAWVINWSELTWGPGQTRWLILRLEPDSRWQIAELRASPPER
jgi:hypothetical protein